MRPILKICESCKHLLHRGGVLYCLAPVDTSNRELTNEVLFNCDCNKISLIGKDDLKNKPYIYPFAKIPKDCPYYLEHLISRGNDYVK